MHTHTLSPLTKHTLMPTNLLWLCAKLYTLATLHFSSLYKCLANSVRKIFFTLLLVLFRDHSSPILTLPAWLGFPRVTSINVFSHRFYIVTCVDLVKNKCTFISHHLNYWGLPLNRKHNLTQLNAHTTVNSHTAMSVEYLVLQGTV